MSSRATGLALLLILTALAIAQLLYPICKLGNAPEATSRLNRC